MDVRNYTETVVIIRVSQEQMSGSSLEPDDLTSSGSGAPELNMLVLMFRTKCFTQM